MITLNLPTKDENGINRISYSQLSLWCRDREEYVKRYITKEPIDELKDYMEFGSKVGKDLKNNNFDDWSEKERSLLRTIPRLDVFEKEIKIGFNDFYINGYIDTCAKDLSHIIDYKTGTKYKVENYQSKDYKQLDVYGLYIKSITGVFPKAQVILIDRKGNAYRGEKLEIGDKIWTIDIERTEEDLERTKSWIIKTVKDISDYYNTYLDKAINKTL